MFLGNYTHSIDEKGRVTIPARYRQVISDGAYITQGLDRNLLVLPTKIFNTYVKRLEGLTVTDDYGRKLRRILFAQAEYVEPDGSGRILVPTFLREMINLNGEVILVGAGNYFELWSAETWQEEEEILDGTRENGNFFSSVDLSFSEDEV